MSVERVAWSVTVLICAITALLLFLDAYAGYGVLAVAVGLAAAINLR